MAVLKRSLRRKNATGNYDTIRLESDSSIVYRPSGRTVEQDLAAYLPSTQSSDVVPKTLSHGKIMTGTSKIFAGILDNIVELSIVQQSEIPLPPLGEVIFTGDVSNRLYWRVCNINVETRIVYLITKDIIKPAQWNTTDTTSSGYEASNIKKECNLFLNEYKLNDILNDIPRIIDTGVGKVFIPTKEQMNGGFSWFNSNERRIANLYDRATIYWTADTYRTDTTYAWMVTTEGSFSIQPKYSSHGFRPCICIQY